MSNAEARREATQLPAGRPMGAKSLGAIAVAAGLTAGLAGALALWWRFGEGVFSQALLNAVIACF